MYNLTTPQQNIWNLQKTFPETGISNLCGAVFWGRNVDNKIAEKAINIFIEQQSGMRLQFHEKNSVVTQYVASYTYCNIPLIKFNNKQELDEYTRNFAQCPFEMIDKPLWRFVLFELDGMSGGLVCMNHLIADAWTFSLLAKRVYNLCNELEKGYAPEHQEYDYTEFVLSENDYFKSERIKKDEAYWNDIYTEKPENSQIKIINTPVTMPTAQRFTTILTPAQTVKLNTFCAENNVSQAVLFETAVFTYLSKINYENKYVTIGIPVLNRKNKKEKSTVGMFISTIPFTVEINHQEPISSFIERITDSHSRIFRHQRYPYSNILRNLRSKHQFEGNLYDAIVSFQNAKTEENITTQWFSNGYSEIPFSLHIDNRDSADSYTLNVDYQTEVFRHEEEISMLVDRLMLIINQIIENPQITVDEIKIIPKEEYQKLIFDFNDTAVDYPRVKCIHELFEEQVKKTPDKTALVFEDKQFTYKQLDEMSNSLAHYLREEKNIQSNEIVPIIAKRSWHIIVAMLGILKAGGAYLPVSTDLPSDRIKHMLCESNSRFALIYSIQPDVDIDLIDLNYIKYNEHIQAVDNINNANDLCYVLFTSGSTGKPKATMISHNNLSNFVNKNSVNNIYQCNMVNCCDTVLALTTFSFDISVFEIYLSLINGLKVVLSNEEENLLAESLAKLIVENEVDVVHSTPTKFLAFLNNEEFQKAAKQLKMLMIGAEVFTDEIYNTISKYTDATIYNGYGPTETTIGVTFKRINNIHPCIHELFEEQTRKTPDKIALVFEDKKFTYKQLDEMSNSLAHYLREEKGIKPNDIVPIIAKRSWHIIVAMLGILKAGGAFFLLDYKYPVDRISYLISEVNAKIILTLDYEIDSAVDISDINLDNVNSIMNSSVSNDLSCVIHTSGSTGRPKVASLTHNNLLNYIEYAKKFFFETEQVISSATVSFDAFVLETIVPLCNSTTIVLLDENQITKQSEFEIVAERYNNSFMFHTPTKLLNYIRNSNTGNFIKHVKAFVIGGEVFSEELYTAITSHNTNCNIYNLYGPTETTISATVDDVENIDITIGKPIANTQIYILDKNKKPLPIGVAGELCISGDGVGKGYLNRPELTAEKFIPNPFYDEKSNSTAGKIMYCTGDLAQWRVDGEIEYLGRIDTQVKIRGLRIELGEIESVMSSFDSIRLTAVTDKRDENNRQYLVGYYTSETEIDEKALRQYLSAKLPKYMVPNYFVHLEEMPMTASGKTDRKNLPLPDFTVSTNEYVAPETETEKAIAAIWSKLLKVENVGKTDDFYDLGGDSLMAISLLNHLENAFGTEITMKDILEHPVLESLAKRIESSERKTQKILATGSDKYTLLPQQKAIYAVCSKNPDTLTYNMPTRIPLDESIDREKIKKCFIQLIQNHSSLRTYISAEVDDVFGIIDNDAYLTFEKYSEENYMDFVRPFDLSKAPLMRIGFTETVMLFDMHHIIADGESLNLILHDLTKLYFDEETAVNDVQYADYAAYFKKADFSEHKAFYKDMLRCDFEPTVLPERKHQGEAVGISKMYRIDAKTFELAKKYAKDMGLTETMLFLGVYGILLSKYTAKSEVLSSIVLTNRIHRETQAVVGMFVSTLPIMMKADGTVSEYFANVKQLVLNLFAYQELPFFDAADAVGMTDKSVINTSFVYQADGEKKLSIGSAELLPEFIDTYTSKFDLTFEMTPNENGCTVRIEYDSGKYEEALIDRLFAAFGRILNQLEKEKITDISVLSKDEYQKVIFDFNDTAVEYPRDKCIHELFSEQAARTPDKIALVFEDKKFTYKQLDEMSNSLAHYLREEKGIKPNDIVPIIAKRNWHIIVAMLGILKAGGAYMPVDPTYPVDRIAFMMEESNAKVALTFGYEGKIDIDSIELEIFDYSRKTNQVENLNTPNDLCYLIFTSGSTGKPKGTMLTHATVRNYSHCNDYNVVCKIIKNSYESILSVTNIVFDIFVTESILAVLNGLTIYFASDDEATSQNKLAALIEKNNIDVMQTTPTKMRGYMINKDNLRYLRKLKTIILGGEALPKDLYEELSQHTNAKIYNIYGPAETTVWSTNSHVENIDITIGNPIANTQIYILDNNRKPLPIGVAGELCISGDGVGKGYLNRPELTAEKFIPNPFYDEKKNPTAGKIMYCTGDLARWRVDGELEYLGRIDTQVKIRGLRIELGEIESVMSTFDGINITAVTDKRDENNRQYLVGYYTSEIEVDEKSLRQHLSAKLPKYMVPNYFVHLEEMPMTASGKTDRKNLPMPDFTVSQNEYVAPETENEVKLCSLIAQLFGMEKVGVTDDFFDIGGDSLRAIEYVAKAHNEGVFFNLQNVFDYPTVRRLCESIENGDGDKISYADYDFSKISGVLEKNKIENILKPVKTKVGNLLLAGATGYLGIHILADFLEKDTGTVYCLVRGKNTDDSKQRLNDLLGFYFDDKYLNNDRIEVVCADLQKEYFGLSENEYEKLSCSVDTVINSAASVKHYGSYKYFYEANVATTKRLIKFCKESNAKLIHTSTLSVSGNSFADEFDGYVSGTVKHFYESSLYIGQPLENVYSRSKFAAELEVLEAISEGLQANIMRMGNLTNRFSDGKFQKNYETNAFLQRIHSILELGIMPDYLMELYAEFTPIDEAAEAVMSITRHFSNEQTVFHINSIKVVYMDKLVEYLARLGIKMRLVNGGSFSEILRNTAKQSGMEHIFETFINDMDENEMLKYDSNIRIENEFTVEYLKKLGFEWHDIDFEYLRKYIEYFRQIGYVEG